MSDYVSGLYTRKLLKYTLLRFAPTSLSVSVGIAEQNISQVIECLEPDLCLEGVLSNCAYHLNGTNGNRTYTLHKWMVRKNNCDAVKDIARANTNYGLYVDLTCIDCSGVVNTQVGTHIKRRCHNASVATSEEQMTLLPIRCKWSLAIAFASRCSYTSRPV